MLRQINRIKKNGVRIFTNDVNISSCKRFFTYLSNLSSLITF